MAISIHSSLSPAALPSHLPASSSPDTSKAISNGPSANGISQTAYVVEVSQVETEPLDPVPGPNGENSPLSNRELGQLYRVLKGEMDEDLLEELGNVLESLGQVEREQFLTVAAKSGDALGDLVGLMNGLGEGERALFLEAAQGVGDQALVSSFVNTVSSLDSQDRGAFLQAAHDLSRNGTPTDMNHFIQAAEDNSLHALALAEKTQALADTPEQQSQFLALAAVSGDELGRLISTLGQMEDEGQEAFLEAAQGAGKGMTSLLDLVEKRGVEKQGALVQKLNALSPDQREGFLLAADGDEEQMKDLFMYSRNMTAENQAIFFSLAQDADGDTEQLFDLVAAMGAEEKNHFMATAGNAGKGSEALMDLLSTLDGADRKTVLSLTPELQFHELKSFLNAAQPTNAALVAETAGQLDGRDRRYFLYAASGENAQVDKLADLTLSLDGQARSDLLFIATNTQGGDPDLLTRLEKADTQGAEELLAQERRTLEKEGDQGLFQEYVYLRSVFEPRLFEKIVGQGEDTDALVEKLETMAQEQRESFISVVEKIGAGAMVELASVILDLNTGDTRAFMDMADTLAGSDLEHFIGAVSLGLDQSGGDRTGFHQLISLTRELPSSERSDFLQAAAGAGKDLNRLMDITDQLSGQRRSDFLEVAAYTADREVGGRPLMGFLLDSTSRMETVADGRFSAHFGQEDAFPSQLNLTDLHEKINGTTGFFRSAAWLANQEISNGHMADWFNSFLGIPRAYMAG